MAPGCRAQPTGAWKQQRKATRLVQRILSSHIVVQQRLSVAWLQKVIDSGIPAIELFCARQHIDYKDKAQIRELGLWFRDSPLKVHSMHSPMHNDIYSGRSGPAGVITLTETTKAERIKNVDEVKWAIEISESIPFRYLIQHIGVLHEAYDERKVEAAFNSLEELNLFAKPRGIEILLENIPNELSTAERLKYFLSTTHLDLGFVFDTGHANIGAGVEHEFEIMKDRIRSLHIHDNDGKEDKHLFPFLAKGGTIDWGRTMELLRSRANQYPLLLELKETPDFPNALSHTNEIFERLESA
jgi:sugar phosphate isomerase/epimerase